MPRKIYVIFFNALFISAVCHQCIFGTEFPKAGANKKFKIS